MRWLFCNKVETVLFITVDADGKSDRYKKISEKSKRTQSEM